MKKIIFAFIVILTFQTGCTKLDTELYDKILPSDYVADPVLKMSPIYAPMKDFIDDNGNWWFAQELTADAMCPPTRAADWDDSGKWRLLHTHEWSNNTETVNRMWGKFYNGVVEANKFLEEMGAYEPAPIIDQGIAKAKILRAYYYYLLIDNYKNVPYVTSYLNAEESPMLNFRKDIFDSIIKEIEINAIKLPNTITTKTGVTKGMAYSLLAKLYLNSEVYTGTPQWSKAEQYCDSVISLNAYSLVSNPLEPFVTNNGDCPENIFIIPFNEDTYQGFRLHMRILHYNSNLTYDMTVGPWNGFAAIEDFYNTYEDIDIRKSAFLVGQQYKSNGDKIFDEAANADLIFDPHIPALKMDGSFTPIQIRMSGVRPVKFEVKLGAKENLSNQFPIFRYADVLLMKAECQIRNSGDGAGDELINQIRTRAGVSLLSGVGLDELLAERGREMFFEGHRRQDLIRFGKFNNAWWE
ncbi:MAG: RagB/SusD family nutrient uptake outer membrane protein, partial [Bacteroidales bacterium]